MMWGLAAALAAGIAGDVRILGASLFLFCSGAFVGSGGPGRHHMAALALVAVFFFLYGHLAMRLHHKKTRTFDMVTETRGGEICLDGWVASYPQYRYGGMAFEFVTRLGCGAGMQSRVLVKTKEFMISYGDSLRVCGRAYYAKGERGISYARYLKGRGLFGELRVPAVGVEFLPGHCGNAFIRRVLWPVHQRVRCELVRALGARSGVPVALLIGERGFLGRGAPGTFARLGISHLLALSGLHLGFVAGALLLIFRVTRCRSGYLLILTLAAYVGLVGFIISLTRALFMAVLLIVASMLHRPMKPVAALGNAFLMILLLYPASFFSLGFQLSFLATYGVLRCVALMGPAGVERWLRKVWLAVRSSLLVSVSAQAFVAPVIIYYFGGISVIAPVATLIFVFPVVVLLTGAALCVGVTSVWRAGGLLGFAALERVVVVFDAAVKHFADFAPERLTLPAPDMYLYYAGLAVMYHAGVRKRTRIGGLALVIAAFVRDLFF